MLPDLDVSPQQSGLCFCAWTELLQLLNNCDVPRENVCQVLL